MVEQLSRIINVDKSFFSLDGSNGHRGGCMEALFYCSRLPQTGRATVKSIMTTTLINGSTAAREAIPTHFQFSKKTQTAETEKLRVDLVAYMSHVRGKFGAPEEQASPIIIGMNAKGGMDDVEFNEYLSNSLIILYLDVEDVKVKRMILKIDSGPGRLEVNLLARLRLLGFVFYPGVPNTTAVSQDTYRNYSFFKIAFRIIHDKIFQEKMLKIRKRYSIRSLLV